MRYEGKKNEHHGGSWKVAYADFVTADDGLVPLLVAHLPGPKNQGSRRTRVPKSVFVHHQGIRRHHPELKDATATYKQSGNFQSVSAVEMETMRRLSEDLEKLLREQDTDQSSVKIDMTPDGLCINVFDRARKPIFKSGTEDFTEYGSWVFSTLAWEISRYTAFRIEIQGHTETVEIKPEPSPAAPGNWELSTGRSNAACRKLVQNGVVANQICKVSGYADVDPVPDYPPTDEINRRVTVMLKLKESLNSLDNASALNTP